MDRLYACIIDNVVSEIKKVSEEESMPDFSDYELVFDITGCERNIKAGWVLQNGQFADPGDLPNDIEPVQMSKMDARFRFGNQLCDHMIKILSIKNLVLGKTSSQVSSMISAFLPVEMALRKCALPTALGAMRLMRPAYGEYSEEFQYAIDELENFLAGE
jgi:hypothetical protein